MVQKDLYKDFPGASRMDRGYSTSPIAYKNTIILTVGGHGHAVIALNPLDGSLVWAKNDLGNSPSSPVLINVAGQDQLVAFLDDGGDGSRGLITGIDPNNGLLLWQHPHKTSWDLNIALPLWGDDGILVVSSAYGTGSPRPAAHAQRAGRPPLRNYGRTTACACITAPWCAWVITHTDRAAISGLLR